ncbi:hypothetical protein IM660_07720 [Ruania alkalisoli]|uniref:Uncharacterized protein n=1 Tax=Ruania alkalisoli TaxID=2779775 RepID=A0A7M1SX36_9MICO|nr:hypothetical protein [Ruania alkalisoli]QOR72115.1 hypothetical protein IM660_07720 [Ruania alkalisoli]
MSTTTDTTTGAAHAVAAYAGAVRHHLNDLQPETLDELTGGLEADLNDSLADRLPQDELDRLTLTDLARRFGDPGDYAAEMRDAAGIAPAVGGTSGRRTLRHVLSETGRGIAERWSAFVARHRVLTAVAPVVRDLRPIWWIFRAWVLYQVFGIFVGENFRPLPDRPLVLLVLVVLVILSVQWGRGAIDDTRRRRALGVAASALAVTLALPILVLANNAASRAVDNAYRQGHADGSPTTIVDGTPTDGVFVDGARAGNLFVYGPDGQPIEGAQIVDQDGNPLILQPEGGDWMMWESDGVGIPGSGVPLAALEGAAPLNAFPYPTISPADLIPEPDGGWTWDPEAVREPRWPAPSLFPLPETVADPDGSADPEESADADTAEPEASGESRSDETSSEDPSSDDSSPEDSSPAESE